MLVPAIGDIADSHWNKDVQEKMIQVKSVLRETDSYQFEEAMRMTAGQKKMYATKQDEQDRKDLDRKWDKLNFQIKVQDPQFEQPAVPFKAQELIANYNELYSNIYDKDKR